MSVPLHVITIPNHVFKQSVYFSDHVCHFEETSETLTTCKIKVFKWDMSYILSEKRDLDRLKFPGFNDDHGALEFGPLDFSIWFKAR